LEPLSATIIRTSSSLSDDARLPRKLRDVDACLEPHAQAHRRQRWIAELDA
jgi:hypothetical protein